MIIASFLISIIASFIITDNASATANSSARSAWLPTTQLQLHRTIHSRRLAAMLYRLYCRMTERRGRYN